LKFFYKKADLVLACSGMVADELLNKNGGNFQGVPVTDINGELVLGFDRPKLQDLLRKNGLLAD
jgi:hypothetical protein